MIGLNGFLRYRKFILPAAIIIVCLLSVRTAPAQEYIVGEGDVIKITVYNHPDLTTTARVTGGGDILFPLIGQVRVGGLSISNIVEKISAKLSDGYIVDPHVTVFIEEYRSKRAVMMGQVQNPGLFVLHGHITFLELISKAGGLTKDAGDKATIKRRADHPDKRENSITIDLKNLIEKGDMSLDIPIMDGDSIYIPKSGVFYATGEVKNPSSYKHTEGLTVVKAITMAGGFTDKAATGRVKIMRKTEGKEEIIERVKMDAPVFPDDVIVVPESFF